jgi:hypothetical protein
MQQLPRRVGGVVSVMTTRHPSLRVLALSFSALCLCFPTLDAQSARDAAAPALRDGARDFDFEMGSWKTHLRRLKAPLSGSTEWLEYEGTSVVRPVWGGGANLVELDVTGPAGRLEVLSLRLYDPTARQWSLNSASRRGGTISVPVVGEFRDGRGEFHSFESFNGRMIHSRFVITVVTPDSLRFEQSFSADGGKNWELNWVAIDTRTPGTVSTPRRP